MAANSRSWIWPLALGILLLALIAQSALLYPRLRVRDAEIATLRASVQEEKQSAAAQKAAEIEAVQSQEVARLRKDNQELHRLRNEVRQLREATQQSAVKPAQAPSTATPAAATQALAQLQRQVQQLQAENAQLRAQHQELDTQAQGQVQLNACINNLRQLDGAKQQWALENRQPAEALPEAADLEPYLRDPATFSCPAGGVYTLNAVELPPMCSVPGHALP
jgi:uncharacterized protein YhaN